MKAFCGIHNGYMVHCFGCYLAADKAAREKQSQLATPKQINALQIAVNSRRVKL